MVKKMTLLMSVVLMLAIAGAAFPETIMQLGFEGTGGEDVPAMNDDTGAWGPFTHHEGANAGATITYDSDSAPDSTGSTSGKFTTDGTATGNSDTFILLAGTQDIDLGSYGEGLTAEAFIKANSAGSGHRCVFSEEIAFKMYLFEDNLYVDRKWGPGKWNENFTEIMADFTGKYDQWHHVAAVWSSAPDGNGKRLKLYIDGEEAASSEGNAAGTINAGPDSGFAVGGYMRSAGTSFQYWDGYIDDFRLSDAALDPSDFIGAGAVVAFDSAASGAIESVSPAELTVILDNPEQGQTYTVDYAVTGGTATAGVDYTLAGGTLTFNPGETSKTISIDIVDDGVDEENETIEVTLSNASGGNVELGTAQHIYTILDPRPRVEFAADASSVSERVKVIQRPVEIPVRLSVPASATVTVDYAVAGDTATQNVDYILDNGTLSFAAGEQTAYVSFNIVDDNVEEADETIVLRLLNPSVGSLLGEKRQHSLTIIDGGRLEPDFDLNQDGQVDFDDVVIFLKDWLECTLNPPELCWQ